MNHSKIIITSRGKIIHYKHNKPINIYAGSILVGRLMPFEPSYVISKIDITHVFKRLNETSNKDIR